MTTAEDSESDFSGYGSPSPSRPGLPTRRQFETNRCLNTGASSDIGNDGKASVGEKTDSHSGDYSAKDQAYLHKCGFIDVGRGDSGDGGMAEEVEDAPPSPARTPPPRLGSVGAEEPVTPAHRSSPSAGSPPARPVRDSPIARTQNGQKSRFGPNTAESRYIRLAEEVSKCVVGPVDVEMFLGAFLPALAADKVMPESKGAFDGVPGNPTAEKQIYEPLIKAINEKERCPNVMFVDTSVSSDRSRGIYKPDVTGYDPEDIKHLEAIQGDQSKTDANDPGSSNAASRVQPARKAKETAVQQIKETTEPSRYSANLGLADLFMEIKNRALDPFRDEHVHDDAKKRKFFAWEGQKFDSDRTKQLKKTLGQIAAYASDACARQHRMFYFSVLIVGTHARLFRWDRAGVVVTKAFDYRKQPELLCEFLWRFGNTNQIQRGFDPTVVVASEDERELFEKVISEEVRFQLNISDAKEVQKHVKLHYEKGKVTKVQVYNKMTSKWEEYLVSVPITSPRSFAGRCTRAYWSVRILHDERGKIEGQVAFLKDMWRIDMDQMDNEGSAYEDLHKGNAKRIPGLQAYGDVPLSPDSYVSAQSGDRTERAGPQTKYQCTRTQDITDGLCPCVNVAVGRRRIIKHTHFRLTLTEVGYSLKNFENSRELFTAGGHAFEALESAYAYNRRMHRDVSLDNIILVRNRETGEREGRLVDWEFSTIHDPASKGRDYFRSGTWAFMSAQALDAGNKNFKHTNGDDLESLFYVLMYASLLWLNHNETENFGEWMFRFFDDGMVVNGRDSGGLMKQVYIITPTKFTDSFKFDEPIQTWFTRLYKALQTTTSFAREMSLLLQWTREVFRKEIDEVIEGLKDVQGNNRTEHDVGDYRVSMPELFRATVTKSGLDPSASNVGGSAASGHRGSKRPMMDVDVVEGTGGEGSRKRSRVDRVGKMLDEPSEVRDAGPGSKSSTP